MPTGEAGGFKKGDILVAAALLFLALAFWALAAGRGESELVAQISVDGEVIKEITLSGLSEKETFVIRNNGYMNSITAENGAVYVQDSDCPDRVCVNTGRLTRAGQSAVCMKTHVVIRILGARKDVDAVSG